METDKAAVQAFWDEASCGEVYATGVDEADRYEQQSATRYLLEPYLKPFARFDGANRAVLEVGVGMGADHVEWSRSGPARLVGVDLSARALNWTSRRMKSAGLSPELVLADAESLPFPDEAFDVVYSWGVLHHTPDTPRAFAEVHRVLRPGGVLRAMVYHRPSLVGAMLWARYGLMKARPLTSMAELYADRLESPGTSGYRVHEARGLVERFARVDVRPQISLGDLLQGEVGQRHGSASLRLLKGVWPRPFVRKLRPLGLFLLIEAVK